ncbi:LacI family DNA-binding transcriptional regulator [Tomitella gaofuii]|uniref:LacI family DNA-binding transcriptional regulator n=1 Tax=Tomitella gaofuii TaxID=2760083 RepID=UPI0015FE74BB|nr:LacI family DNA-binding transcriptional regulator [Tomitella gaofuii]
MARQPRHSTLHTIAEETGVSASTVSRVLNAESASAARRWASHQTIERVRKAADRHAYTPNPQAVGLRTQRSNFVGMVVPRMQDYVLATIHEGVDEAAVAHGYTTLAANSLDQRERQQKAVELLAARRVEGLIFGDAFFDGEFLREVHARGLKFVLVSRRSPGFPSVTCDDELGGRLAGRHLAKLGCRRVAVLAGQPYASTGIDRTAGLVAALAEAGVAVPDERIIHGPFDARGGRAAAEELLAQGPPYPDAIFATNDFAAIGAMGALRDHGLRAPDDIVLIGYNDTTLAAELPVPLTSVHSPMHRMGSEGFAMLLGVLDGEDPEPVELEPTLIVRESSAGRGAGAQGSSA